MPRTFAVITLAELKSELLKWMFLFWITTLGSLFVLRGP